jgi:hypothetical protein
MEVTKKAAVNVNVGLSTNIHMIHNMYAKTGNTLLVGLQTKSGHNSNT